MPDEFDAELDERSQAYQDMLAKLGTEQIVIERREVVDSIMLTEDGAGMPNLTEPEYNTPLVAAFVLVAKYLEGCLGDELGIAGLEFKYQAHTFRIAAEFTG